MSFSFPADAKTVRSEFDLKFYEITSYNEPAQYLGFTSSKLDNFVSVPISEMWYVRPDGPMKDETYDALFADMKTRKFPGLDVSNRWDVKNQTLAHLGEVDSLRILKLTQTKVTPAGLAILEKLPELKVLTLNNQTTDAGLRYVSKLQKLEFLDAHGTKITDQGISHLTGLKRLVAIDLSFTRLTDAGVKALLQIMSLKQIDVSGTLVSDKGMALLASLPKIETLYVSGRTATLGLKAIAKLKKLKNLDMSGTQINDASLAALGDSKVEALALSGTSVGDAGLSEVARIKSLKTLELSDTKMTPEGLYALSELPKLETLSLSWTELTDPELQALSNLRHLQRVILSGRTLPPQTLNRIRAMAKLIKPRAHIKMVTPVSPVPPKTAVDQRTAVAVAPSIHPVATAPAPKLLESRSMAVPRVRPGGDVVRGNLPPDIPATPMSRSAIADDSPKGQGMMIEVGAAPASGQPRKLTGLKRIYAAELTQRSHDNELDPGASPAIHFSEDNPDNGLGNIEVGTSPKAKK